MLALLDLPDELLLHVALQCDDAADVSRFARTCTALHALITRTDHFWSLMLARHFNVHADDSAVDHRALFRERCEQLTPPLEWKLPSSPTSWLSHPSAEQKNVVQLALPFARGLESHYVFTSRALISASSLPSPSQRLAAFRVALHMHYAVGLTVGLAVLVGVDGGDDGDSDAWSGGCDDDDDNGLYLQTIVYVACADGAGSFGRSADYDDSGTQPVFVPPGWRAGADGSRGPDALGFVSGDALYFVLDAERGRVYYAVDNTEHFLVAFDDARLARAADVRVFVCISTDRTSARIDRVRVTREMRERLRALDAACEQEARGAQ